MGEFAELDGEHVPPSRHPYRGKPGYGAGKPWHQRVTTWTSRDGKVTKLRNLADSHLENILAFLRRWAHNALARGMHALLTMDVSIMGDAANDAIDAEINQMTQTNAEDLLADLPIYRALCREADRRAALLGLVPAVDTPVYPTDYHRPRRALSRHDEKYILADGWGD